MRNGNRQGRLHGALCNVRRLRHVNDGYVVHRFPADLRRFAHVCVRRWMQSGLHVEFLHGYDAEHGVRDVSSSGRVHERSDGMLERYLSGFVEP